MKKILSVIIMMLIMIPCVVFADMGAPVIKEYKASVKNPNGAILWKYNDSGELIDSGKGIKNGTVITILYEEDGRCEADGYEGYILISDIRAVEENYTPEKLGDSKEFLTTKKVDIKKGPAEGYDSTGISIPGGTTVTVREVLEKDENGEYFTSSTHWYYIEYKGTKGFVSTLTAALAWKGEYLYDMATYKTTKVFDTLNNKVIATIPPKTILKKANLYDLDGWTRGYYLSYDNVQGIVKVEDIAWFDEEGVTVTTTKMFNLYEEGFNYEDETPSVIGTVPEGTTFKSKIVSSDPMGCNVYYENGDVKGWINAEFIGEDDECRGLKLKYPDDEVIEEHTEEVEETTPDDTLDATVIEPAPSDVVIEPTPSGLSQTSKVQLYILLAIMCCLTAVVIVLLINNGKNKTAEVTEEVKEEVKEVKEKKAKK